MAISTSTFKVSWVGEIVITQMEPMTSSWMECWNH